MQIGWYSNKLIVHVKLSSTYIFEALLRITPLFLASTHLLHYHRWFTTCSGHDQDDHHWGNCVKSRLYRAAAAFGVPQVYKPSSPPSNHTTSSFTSSTTTGFYVTMASKLVSSSFHYSKLLSIKLTWIYYKHFPLKILVTLCLAAVTAAVSARPRFLAIPIEDIQFLRGPAPYPAQYPAQHRIVRRATRKSIRVSNFINQFN